MKVSRTGFTSRMKYLGSARSLSRLTAHGLPPLGDTPLNTVASPPSPSFVPSLKSFVARRMLCKEIARLRSEPILNLLAFLLAFAMLFFNADQSRRWRASMARKFSPVDILVRMSL